MTARRVTLLVHALNDRGIASAVGSVAEETASLGHDVTLVAAQVDPDARRPHGVTVVDLGTTGRLGRGRALRAVLRSSRAEVLYAHGNGPARTAVLATRQLRPRPRVVTVEHNHYSSYPWRWPRLRHAVNATVLPMADTLVGVSPGVTEDLAERFPRAADKAVTVPSPLTRWRQLDELAAEPVDHPWFDQPEPVIVTVGHVHRRKDHATLVRAAAHVRDLTGSSPRVVIIGAISDPELHERLLAEVEQAGLADSVTFLGAQPNPLKYVARATAFALTSTNEGLGIAILEALALGIPTVSTDCPSGPAWVLENGAAGLLAPVGDHVAVGQALVRVLEDPQLRADLVQAGRRRVLDFAPEQVARAYLDLAHG